MQVTVLYFASLADQANKDQERLDFDTPIDLATLYQWVSDKYQFSHPPSQLRVAINDNFAQWSDSIHPGDSIAFIPPVAGG